MDDTKRAELLELALGAAWDRGGKPKRYRGRIFSQTQHIVLRFPRCAAALGAELNTASYDHLWPELAPAAVELAELAAGPGHLSKLMLSRLPAGAVIYPHVDADPCNAPCLRIHVPLQTALGAVFVAGARDHHLELGWAWEVNNRIQHAVRNDSQVDRLHLVLDLLPE